VTLTPTRAWALAASLGALVLAVDQAAKAAIEANLAIGEHVEVLGPLELTLAHNDGVAFGLAGGGGALLIAVGLVALGAVGYLFARNPTRPWMWLATGLVAGGALGNLTDRIRAEAVTDYIDVLSWPPFNLADVAITFGVIVFVALYLNDAAAEGRADA
jgi:signal peptidase II